MWFHCTKTVRTKLKVAYNNSLRRFMGLPWHNSASEMFVNLNIKSFGELLRVFVHGFRSRITVSRKFILSCICNSSCSIYSCSIYYLVMGLVANITVCPFVTGHIRIIL